MWESRGGHLPGEPVEMAVELLNPTLWHTCDKCVHGRNKTKDSDYHGSDWTDYGRSELVMGLVVMPPAELFAHIQAASMNVCAAYRNWLLGAPFMHMWAAYQICGAKQEICGGVSCMQRWVMHICTTLWACHRWAHLASLGCGLTTYLCILTLLLDKLLKWLSCQPFTQISRAHTFPRSKPPRLIRGGWRWHVSCSKKTELLRIRQLLVVLDEIEMFVSFLPSTLTLAQEEN